MMQHQGPYLPMDLPLMCVVLMTSNRLEPMEAAGWALRFEVKASLVTSENFLPVTLAGLSGKRFHMIS